MSDMVLHGDCLEVLKSLPSDSFDCCITDPPYGLSKEPHIREVLQHWLAGDRYEHKNSGFMGKSWDSFVPGPEYWQEVYRVMKPGAHLLAFGGTRTYDLLVIALRLAGFECRDMLMWIHGQGFPKSTAIDKQIDKMLGAEREVIGVRSTYRPNSGALKPKDGFQDRSSGLDTKPATPEAAQWAGWGSALKPAHEPIILARKPLAESSIAAQVLATGTGGLNIGATRIQPMTVDPLHGAPAYMHSPVLGALRDTDSFSVDGFHDALKHISSALRSCSTSYTSLLHGEVDQGDMSPFRALCESMHNRLYPNGVWNERTLLEPLSFQVDCPSCSRFYDVHFHAVQEAAQVSAASLADALSCIGSALHELQYSHDHPCICHPSNSGAYRLAVSLLRSLTGFNDYTTYSSRPSRKENLMRPERRGKGVTGGWANYSQEPGMYGTPEGQGRFPSHLLLSHSLWCIPQGVKRVRGTHGNGTPIHANGMKTEGWGHKEHVSYDYTDADGYEQVEAYDCAPDCPIAELDRQSGVRKSKAAPRGGTSPNPMSWGQVRADGDKMAGYDDQGGASRYFTNFPPDDYTPYLYQSKASRAERNKGCEDLPETVAQRYGLTQELNSKQTAHQHTPQGNGHPTVKPLQLMRWLIRLITPPDGIVLDPFCGSGSTCVAAIHEGKHFIGIEQDESYVNIANARIEYARTHEPDVVQVATKKVKGNGAENGNRLTRKQGVTYNPGEIRSSVTHRDSEGMEEVEDWECAPDCPVRILGEQSGERKSAYPGNPEKAAQQSHKHYEDIPTKIYGDGLSQRVGRMTSDTGTAARYFQQFPPDSLWCDEVEVGA